MNKINFSHKSLTINELGMADPPRGASRWLSTGYKNETKISVGSSWLPMAYDTKKVDNWFLTDFAPQTPKKKFFFYSLTINALRKWKCLKYE